MFQRVNVNGFGISSLYDYMVDQIPVGGDIKDNFTKFLICREG